MSENEKPKMCPMRDCEEELTFTIRYVAKDVMLSCKCGFALCVDGTNTAKVLALYDLIEKGRDYKRLESLYKVTAYDLTVSQGHLTSAVRLLGDCLPLLHCIPVERTVESNIDKFLRNPAIAAIRDEQKGGKG